VDNVMTLTQMLTIVVVSILSSVNSLSVVRSTIDVIDQSQVARDIKQSS
jgi:hypothetical protein